MVLTVEMLIGVFGQALSLLLKSSAPTVVTDAVTAAITALENHKQDLITKAALEANRG